MPDDNLPSNNDPAANSGASGQSSQPSFVTADQLNQAVNQITQTFQASLQAIASARQDQFVPQNVTPIALPTDNEIIEEIQSGGVTKLRKVIEGAVDRVRREEVAPFQETGMRILGEQSKQLAILSGAMPHYNRFKKEIDTAIQQLPPAQRTSAEVYKGLHDLVVGQNFAVLAREQQEAAIRAARDQDNTSLPGTQGGRQVQQKTDPNAIPSFESIYGNDGVLALSNLGRGGRTADGFAQSMGYKDWGTYYTEVLKPAGIGATNG